MTIKLTDFGFSQFFNPNQEGLTEVLGSPLYMAPEIVKSQKYDTKIDIWSLGVIAYIMIAGHPPFLGRSKEEIFIQVTTQPIIYTDGAWVKKTKQCKNFIKKCLTRDPRLRPTAHDLLNDDWIKSYNEKLVIPAEIILDIHQKLQSFRKYTVFQSGIMTYILSFYESNGELDELREIFTSLDLN